MKTLIVIAGLLVSLQTLAAPLQDWQGNYWVTRNQEQGEVTSASGGIPIFHQYYNKVATWEGATNGYPQTVQIEIYDTSYDALGQQQTGWLRQIISYQIRLVSQGSLVGHKTTTTWPVAGGSSSSTVQMSGWEVSNMRNGMMWEEYGQKDSHPNPVGGYTSWVRTFTAEFALDEEVYWEASYWKFVSDWPTPNTVVHSFFKPAGTPTVRYSYPISASPQRRAQFRTLVSSTPF